MPDWINYFGGYTAGTSTSYEGYEEYQRERERQDCVNEQQMQMFEQQMEEERQLIKDKERYPLFFLKEGIV